MRGATALHERRQADIWLTAMLPNMKKPIGFHEFVYGKADTRAEVVRFTEAWDKLDRALAAGKSRREA